ncbi:hypothetical protein J437_LFUL005640 [Ladona fulva]|uniref:Major facilitator superfamily associated domain-containing protein n=1 Tax=Ladona fulva TaxID=123851 RepID=A0A8K0NYM2_LADFU|nr:hypothetical protein J437_LFUL005640 [Ladona fulva]
MGKQLGISEVVMGSITALLPPLYFLTKPLFGVLVDHFSAQRRIIFLFVLGGQNVAYGLLYFIPRIHGEIPSPTVNSSHSQYNSFSTLLPALSVSSSDSDTPPITGIPFTFTSPNDAWPPSDTTEVHVETPSSLIDANLYSSPAFWIFVVLLSVGTVLFNVANSVSDAITFDLLGEGGELGYGKQRVWGTVGFGVAALLAGSGMEYWSSSEGVDKNYTPALVLALIFGIIDLLVCYFHLQMPLMPRSNHILRDVGKLVCHRKVAVFLVFAAICGILDGFIIYYLFWYLEILAVASNQTSSVKLLEGLVVAAQSLIGETIFFYLSHLVLKWLGNSEGEHSYARALTLSLFSFAVRFGSLSFIPNPWWILPIEAVFQGPSYALSYTAIVGYAAVVSPAGASSTMQGLVAGIDDGLGYAIGSLIGGVLFKYFGGKITFRVFAGLASFSGIVHLVVYEYYLKNRKNEAKCHVKYNPPKEAVEVTALADS